MLAGRVWSVYGCQLRSADYTDLELQNAYYEGYMQCVEVTNLFVFSFHGVVIHTGINYAGI